jgi:single-stranded-DNA-specific exonuclease
VEITKIKGLKYLWRVPHVDMDETWRVASSYNLTPALAQTLLVRGFTSGQEIEEFLFSSYEKDVAHPKLLKDADRSVSRIIQAIKAKEKIVVFGDYDVDGITSSSMMMLCLLPLGARINFFLPHRVRDGYGLSTRFVERAAQNGYTLIITVDNGITAFKPAQRAKELGIDLIITDHHRQHDTLPDAYAIVNPNQDACSYPTKSLAGVGVTFKIVSLLYEYYNKPLPPKTYELLLLGTIADVVPLTQENRYWVRYGLKYVNSVTSHAFKTLKQNGRVTKPKVTSADIGFSITPQINALGRLEDPRDGVKFLIGAEVDHIKRVGTVLFELNQARKEIERAIFEEVQQEIESRRIDLEKETIILAASSKWAPGVIGLVASRLVSTYGRPALLFHISSKGVAKGSCRSIPEFNIFDALAECKDVLTSFGGHSFAAGLALPSSQLPDLKKRLEVRASQILTHEDLQQKIDLDGTVGLDELTTHFMRSLEYLEPFGHENQQPLFYLKGVVLINPPTLLKDKHVKCSLFAHGIIKPCIFFNRPELMDMFAQQGSEPFDCAVHVSENYWNGRSNIELIGLDIAVAPQEVQ